MPRESFEPRVLLQDVLQPRLRDVPVGQDGAILDQVEDGVYRGSVLRLLCGLELRDREGKPVDDRRIQLMDEPCDRRTLVGVDNLPPPVVAQLFSVVPKLRQRPTTVQLFHQQMVFAVLFDDGKTVLQEEVPGCHERAVARDNGDAQFTGRVVHALPYQVGGVSFLPITVRGDPDAVDKEIAFGVHGSPSIFSGSVLDKAVDLPVGFVIQDLDPKTFFEPFFQPFNFFEIPFVLRVEKACRGYLSMFCAVTSMMRGARSPAPICDQDRLPKAATVRAAGAAIQGRIILLFRHGSSPSDQTHFISIKYFSNVSTP